MKVKKSTSLLALLPVLLFLAGSIVFSGCEGSRTGPELPRPNPPAPAPVAVILSGYVIDNTTGGGISGAVVTLAKLDGTSLATATTNSSGLYSFNLTNLNTSETTLNVSTTVAGYGYGFRTATYDKTNGVTSVTPITLTKITNVTTVTIGTAGGAATVPPTSDAKVSTPVTVTVPPNAVPANTQVTVASVPVVSTPPPVAAAATQNIVASNNLSAPGVTTFGAPVTMTFNLPFANPVGTTILLLLFNTATNKWDLTGTNATVAAGGLTATVQVTKPGSYALLGNVGVVQTVNGSVNNAGIGVTKIHKVLDTKAVVIELGPNNTAAKYDGSEPNPPRIVVVSGDANSQPTDAFTYGLVTARFGSHSGATDSFQFTYNLPATLGSGANVFNTTNSSGQVQGPPGHTAESGDWIYIITINEFSVEDIYHVFETGLFDTNAIYSDFNYTITYQWYWRQHNQGGIGVGPF